MRRRDAHSEQDSSDFIHCGMSGPCSMHKRAGKSTECLIGEPVGKTLLGRSYMWENNIEMDVQIRLEGVK